ncbi:MFS domain-containing protein [Fusarium falciforme]|uniref:MFS domain-containing protein n=1 Tax=Fusarium falciforme TaxID=195108 RepID=UPI002301049B|nr:MFS domain-containing protein [Fusarium falciforme]WAO92370.1 MFS domain-containing protein [Fusarium falciforme]
MATDNASSIKAKEEWSEQSQSRAELAARYSSFEKNLTVRQAIKLYWRAILWICYCQLTIIGYGIDGVVAGALTSTPKFREDYGEPFDTGTSVSHIISADWLSIWAGVSQITAIIGGFSVGYLADKVGRKWSQVIFAVNAMAGVALQYASFGSMPLITVGKGINGFSIGAWIVLAPLYASEVAPLPLRGWLTAMTNFFLFCGLLTFNGVIYELGPLDSILAYRLPLALQWAVPALMLLTVWAWPESPTYLIRWGKRDKALKAMRKLYGPDGIIDHSGLYAQIEETLDHERQGSVDSRGYMECFSRENRKRTFIAVFAFTMVQASGGIFVLGYQSYYYQLIGYETKASFLLSMMCNLVMFVGTVLSWFLLDRAGRRPMFVWGELVTACCLFVVGGCSIDGSIASYKAAVAFIFVWAFFFQLTIGTIGFTIVAEVPALRLRSRTQALANISLSLIQWVIGFTFPYLFNPDAANLGGRVGFIYGGLTFLGFLLGYIYIPETRKRGVDELDVLFREGVKPRHFSKANIQVNGGNLELMKDASD